MWLLKIKTIENVKNTFVFLRVPREEEGGGNFDIIKVVVYMYGETYQNI